MRQAAELRQAWLASPERKRFFVFLGLLATTVVAPIAIGFFTAKNAAKGTGLSPDYSSNIGIGVFIWAYLATFITVGRFRTLRRDFKDRLLITKAHDELIKAEESAYSNTDFASLWRVTQKRLDYYHGIATTQSERSFLYSEIAALSGFAVLLASAIAAAFATSLVASISAAIAGISAGGLGAFIGSTFMRSQSLASAQLRDYFRQPLGFSNYLAAERLLDALSDQKERAAAIRDIIKAIVSNGSTSLGSLAESDTKRE
jgi:hypothetical protein